MNACHSLLEDFLPLKLLERIHGSEGRRPAAIQFPAAVMFVDVSRYTALVEQLAHRGREGLEELPRLLSLSYGRCSEHVAELGGEVLYFAGDSLLAYWDVEADQLGAAVQRAVECANIICRSDSDTRRRDASEIIPALHIGIGAGSLWAAALGDQPVWKLIAGGEAVAQAAACQSVARSWSYELSAEAKAALEADFDRSIEVLARRSDMCAKCADRMVSSIFAAASKRAPSFAASKGTLDPRAAGARNRARPTGI